MDFDQLYPNRFMKAGEFQGKDGTFVIASVKLEELGEGNEKKGKAIVSFERTPKQWVMNRTNGTCLKAMFGRETNAWVGKRVTLYPVQITDPFTGELILAIRVRGSPDIAEPISFSARIGRKQVSLKLAKTTVGQARAAGRAQPAQQQKPPEAPPPEEDFGPEPPPDMILPGQEGFTHG